MVSKYSEKILNIGILHECSGHLFEITLDTDCTALNGIPRPLFPPLKDNFSNNSDFILAYKNDEIPIFGSFGFATPGKGFDKMIKLINDQYDNAVIKLIITDAFFNLNKSLISNIREECESIPRKKRNYIDDNTSFFEDEELLSFLDSTTCNIFMYNKGEKRGISSVIDYVLSCSTPFAISDSFMFRHIYDDSISVYHRSIEECIINSKNYCINFKNKIAWKNSVKNFAGFFQNFVIHKNIWKFSGNLS